MNYINKGKRGILIFPDFKNMEKIQEIRGKYDELYKMVNPHITLAFPFKKDISNEQLKIELSNLLKDIKPFKIKCKGISFRKDNKVGTYYIFLNIVDGKEIINEINRRIYNQILPEVDLEKYNYEPHITLGNVDDLDEKIELEDEFETIVNEICIEQIGENEESVLVGRIRLE